ncbi:MAG: hypothetical protein ACKOA5_16220 [Actinomycetota bacterium]
MYEFTAFYNEGLGFTTSLFGSSFYTLTGFHGVHVTVHHHAVGIGGHQQAQSRAGKQVGNRGDGRLVLALRRHRLDHHLYARLPDPDLIPHRTHTRFPP